MSYASLVGIPDPGAHSDPRSGWVEVRGELDMTGEPQAALPNEIYTMGEHPTLEEIVDQGAGRLKARSTFVTEYHHRLWSIIEHVPAQPFPCDDRCSCCRNGRAAALVWGADAAADHIL